MTIEGLIYKTKREGFAIEPLSRHCLARVDPRDPGDPAPAVGPTAREPSTFQCTDGQCIAAPQ